MYNYVNKIFFDEKQEVTYMLKKKKIPQTNQNHKGNGDNWGFLIFFSFKVVCKGWIEYSRNAYVIESSFLSCQYYSSLNLNTASV